MKKNIIILCLIFLNLLLPRVVVLAIGCCACIYSPDPSVSYTTTNYTTTNTKQECDDIDSFGVNCRYYDGYKANAAGNDCEFVAVTSTVPVVASSSPIGIVEAEHVIESLPDVLGGLSAARPAEALATIVGRVINIFLSIIGTITVAMVVYGGWMWMTAQGNDVKIAKATKILIWAFGGVVLVFVSYILVKFIFEVLNV
ncbi:MAG: pilin [Patescibacteria group bacterium]|nr:pilin [Patescibacteria group bacterium]